jgi:hypothetical protein
MILFWKILMILIMATFFPIALIVALKGFADLVSMLKDLAAEALASESENSDS